MDIHLADAGKRYRFEWIFRGLDYHFRLGTPTAITGPNGSGKSTLMKVLSGHLSLTKGVVQYHPPTTPEQVYEKIAYAAPYIDLIEEFTLQELVEFHARLKPFSDGIDSRSFVEMLELEKARHKEIRFFSSGMKQRLKLGLAICAKAPVLLLDEPSVTLDAQAIEWFHRLFATVAPHKTCIIATNDPSDLDLCSSQLNILDFKTVSKSGKNSKKGSE